MPKGKPFQPGQSGNPTGKRPLTPQEKAVKVMTREQFAELAELTMRATKEEIEDLLGGKLPYEQELYIRHMLALGERPDWHQYRHYLERRIGKVPDQLEVTHPKPTVIEKRDGTQVVLGVEDGKEEET
jgi:hypothetical protein